MPPLRLFNNDRAPSVLIGNQSARTELPAPHDLHGGDANIGDQRRGDPAHTETERFRRILPVGSGAFLPAWARSCCPDPLGFRSGSAAGAQFWTLYGCGNCPRRGLPARGVHSPSDPPVQPAVFWTAAVLELFDDDGGLILQVRRSLHRSNPASHFILFG